MAQLTKLERQSFQAYARALRAEFAGKLKRPVQMRVCRVPNDYGDTSVVNGVYLIRVDDGGDYHSRIEVLCHEWSHVLDYDRNGLRVARKDQHNPERWGPIYAEVLNVKDRITEELHEKWNTEERNG
jgi:putative component of toxin-antitoxin plasmid stabilization module